MVVEEEGFFFCYYKLKESWERYLKVTWRDVGGRWKLMGGLGGGLGLKVIRG